MDILARLPVSLGWRRVCCLYQRSFLFWLASCVADRLSPTLCRACPDCCFVYQQSTGSEEKRKARVYLLAPTLTLIARVVTCLQLSIAPCTVNQRKVYTKAWGCFCFLRATGEAGAEPGADDALGRRRPHRDHVHCYAAALRRWRVLGHGA